MNAILGVASPSNGARERELMNVPENLKYTRSDEWVRLDGDRATIGITDYAQHELGEIVYVELPDVGDKISAGVSFGVVESVKAVAELNSPLAGEVVATNTPLSDDPSVLNTSPFEDGWMVQIKVTDTTPLNDLLDAAAYAEYREL